MVVLGAKKYRQSRGTTPIMSGVFVSVLLPWIKDQETTGRNIQIREAACIVAIQSSRERITTRIKEVHPHSNNARTGIHQDKLRCPTTSRDKLRQQNSPGSADIGCNCR